jgi:hypothetical protein
MVPNSPAPLTPIGLSVEGIFRHLRPEPRVVAELADQSQGFFHRLGRLVVERGGFHAT